MSKRLILLRHGNTFESGEPAVQVGLQTDLSLTEAGRGQAKRMAAFLKEEGLTLKAIYAGSLKRQLETAELISDALGQVPIVRTVGLNEIDYGCFEGLSAEELGNRYAAQYQAWTDSAVWPEDCFQGSEEQCLQGLREFLDEVRSMLADGDTALAVSSNGIMRYFYSFLAPEWKKLTRDAAMSSLKVKTGNYCDLRLEPARLVIHGWNLAPGGSG